MVSFCSELHPQPTQLHPGGRLVGGQAGRHGHGQPPATVSRRHEAGEKVYRIGEKERCSGGVQAQSEAGRCAVCSAVSHR